MIVETSMTVMYKQVEDSQAVDTAQLQYIRSMGKFVRSLDVEWVDMRGGGPRKEQAGFCNSPQP